MADPVFVLFVFSAWGVGCCTIALFLWSMPRVKITRKTIYLMIVWSIGWFLFLGLGSGFQKVFVATSIWLLGCILSIMLSTLLGGIYELFRRQPVDKHLNDQDIDLHEEDKK
jgi:hypothetical protein